MVVKKINASEDRVRMFGWLEVNGKFFGKTIFSHIAINTKCLFYIHIHLADISTT